MNQLLSAFTSAWQKSFDYAGRSSRGDYWWFALANFLLGIVLNLASLLGSFFYNLTVVYAAALIIPSLPLAIRRLRDAGKHWGWFFISLVPFIGVFWFIWLMTQPSAMPLS
jgi:uncharacterized membrane protein YhaH (DUF805 family)